MKDLGCRLRSGTFSWSLQRPLKDNSESQLLTFAGKLSDSCFRAGRDKRGGITEGEQKRRQIYCPSPPLPSLPHINGLWIQINYFNNPILNFRPKSVASILIWIIKIA